MTPTVCVVVVVVSVVDTASPWWRWRHQLDVKWPLLYMVIRLVTNLDYVVYCCCHGNGYCHNNGIRYHPDVHRVIVIIISSSSSSIMATSNLSWCLLQVSSEASNCYALLVDYQAHNRQVKKSRDRCLTILMETTFSINSAFHPHQEGNVGISGVETENDNYNCAIH